MTTFPQRNELNFHPTLKGKKIVLGVSGSIAAFKAIELASLLVKAGAQVDTILTEAALRFVGEISFTAITHRPALTTMWGANKDIGIDHVSLGKNADLMLVAPASCNTIAKLAHGLADDLITCTFLATNAPLLIAPAMDTGMFQKFTVQKNVQTLKDMGVFFVGPEEGYLASGAVGFGRMTEPERVIQHVSWISGKRGDYIGIRVLVTAGGTREPIDPFRCITNNSSGKMGFAVAEAARDRGADITLISAPNSLPHLELVRTINVNTALEMEQEVLAHSKDSDLLIMSAAVADFRPAQPSEIKIKRSTEKTPTIAMVPNPDIAKEAQGKRLTKVVFAAETSLDSSEALRKTKAKGAAFAVLNDISAPQSGFGVDSTLAAFVYPNGKVDKLPLMHKSKLAHLILDETIDEINKHQG